MAAKPRGDNWEESEFQMQDFCISCLEIRGEEVYSGNVARASGNMSSCNSNCQAVVEEWHSNLGGGLEWEGVAIC